MNTAAAIGLAAVLGFAGTAAPGLAVIPWLHKLHFGQPVPAVGVNRREKPDGKPAMGGILPAAGTLLAFLVVVLTDRLTGGNLLVGEYPVPSELLTKILSGFFMALAFGMIGLADDGTKLLQKSFAGLPTRAKNAAQFFVIAAYLVSLYLGMGHKPYMYIPFVGNTEIGVFYWFFGAVMLFGTISAVRTADGMDGLCGSITLTAAIALSVIAVLRGLFGISAWAAALAGSCAGFLVWNRPPAKVALGETGSMFLGGMLAALAYAVGCPLILFAVGLVFALEGASLGIFIGVFRVTHGKRIFKAAPIHRRMELSGRKPKTILAVLTAVNLAGCVAGVLMMKR